MTIYLFMISIFEDLSKLFLQYIDLENDIDRTDNISKAMDRIKFEVFISIWS